MAATKDNGSFLDIEKYAQKWFKENKKDVKKKSYEISFDEVKATFGSLLKTGYTLRETNSCEEKVVIATRQFKNDSDGVQKYEFSFEEESCSSTRWTVTKGIKLGASAGVKIGFPASLEGRFRLDSQLNLSKAEQQTHELKKKWADTVTIDVPPRKTLRAKATLKNKKFTSEFTADVELTGQVRFVPKKNKPGREVVAVSVQDLLSNENGFEVLRADGSGGGVIGVKYKVTGNLEGNIGIDVSHSVEEIRKETGNSVEQGAEHPEDSTDVHKKVVSTSNANESVQPQDRTDSTSATGTCNSVEQGAESPEVATDVHQNAVSTSNANELVAPTEESVQPQDQTDSTSATGQVPVIEEMSSVCLDELGKVLDKRPSLSSCFWLHLADKQGVTEKMIKRIRNCFRNKCSPTEHLIDHLSSHKPNLTIQDFLDALEKIDRLDLKQIIAKSIEEIPNVDCNSNFKKLSKVPFGKWVEIVMDLDFSRTSGYKDLAEALGVPKEDRDQFGSDPRSNPTKKLFSMLQSNKPWFPITELKEIFIRMKENYISGLLDKFEDNATVETVYNNIEVMNAIAEVLNKSYSWRDLAGQLKLKSEDVDNLEPEIEEREPTVRLFDHLKQLRPNEITVASVIISLAEMKRYDALIVIKKFGKFRGGFVDRVLQENGFESTEGLKPHQTSVP